MGLGKALLAQCSRYYRAMTERPDPVREYLRGIGSKGGKKGGPARMAQLTAAERRALARKAIRARWAKVKKAKRVK